MALTDALDLTRRVIHQGTWGNLSKETAKVTTLGTEPIGSDLRFMIVPANTRVFDLKAVFADIGAAGALMSWGHVPKAGGAGAVAAFIAATSVATAGSASMADGTISVLVTVESYIVGRLTVAAIDAIGDVDIDIEYVFGGFA